MFDDLIVFTNIEESKEHLFEFFKRQESITREREAKIPEMLEIIDKYFRD